MLMKTDVTFSSGLYAIVLTYLPKKKSVGISELRNRQNNGNASYLALEAQTNEKFNC
jgi:hypothetical protein